MQSQENGGKTMFRKKAMLLFIIMCSASIISIQAQEMTPPAPADAEPPPAETAPGLTHGQVLLYGGIPYLFTYAYVLCNWLVPQPYTWFVASGVTLTGTLPHCLIDPGAGLLQTGASLALYGAAYGTAFAPQLYGDGSLCSALNNMAIKLNWWSYYEGYAKARLQAKPGEYPGEFTKADFWDLFAAPWRFDNWKQTSVWLPILLGAAVCVGAEYFTGGDAHAVWTTGRAYIGSTEVPVLAGLLATIALACLTHTFTGIGEEAVYRGIGYNEMTISLGIVPAKIIDAVSFSALHIPQEIASGYPALYITGQAVWRSVLALGLQWAYDEGGLQASVAQHMWFDVISEVVAYLFNSGVPKASIGLPGLSINFRFPL
jgi:membrane protease YdiL (CAAX protease family)